MVYFLNFCFFITFYLLTIISPEIFYLFNFFLNIYRFFSWFVTNTDPLFFIHCDVHLPPVQTYRCATFFHLWFLNCPELHHTDNIVNAQKPLSPSTNPPLNVFWGFYFFGLFHKPSYLEANQWKGSFVNRLHLTGNDPSRSFYNVFFFIFPSGDHHFFLEFCLLSLSFRFHLFKILYWVGWVIFCCAPFLREYYVFKIIFYFIETFL